MVQTDLKKKILEEMTVEYSNVLEKHFTLAKQFVRVTRDGTVDVIVKDKVPGTDRVLLYLIGKLYAKEAGLAVTDEVGNNELRGQLGVPVGSILPWLKELRDSKNVKQIKREKKVYHTVPINQIESVLKSIEKKVHKKA
jgi:hypothetical protein